MAPMPRLVFSSMVLATTVRLTAFAGRGGAALAQAPQLVRIELQPDSVVAAPGSAVTFKAVGRYADGHWYRTLVDVATDGGVVSPTGIITAGSTEGRFLVIARHPTLALADTAILIVTRAAGSSETSKDAPPPDTLKRPSPPNPGADPRRRIGRVWNEPPGMTTLTDRSFCSRSANLKDRDAAEGWDEVEGRARAFAIVRDPTAPLSPDCVLETAYRAGHRAGTAPGTAQIPIRRRGQRHLYHRFAIKLDAKFVGNQTSTNKLFHLWVGGGNRLFYRAVGAGTGKLNFQIALQGTPDRRRRFLANRGSGEIARGAWYVYEVELIVNTPGQPNGMVRVWTNGALTHEYGDVVLQSGTENLFWDQIQWSPTWGGGGAPVPHSFNVWLDHSYVSTGGAGR